MSRASRTHRYSASRREETAWILDICASSRRERNEFEQDSKLFSGYVSPNDAQWLVDAHWDETVEWAALFGFPTVRRLARGVWGESASEAVPWRKFDRAWVDDAWWCHTEPDLHEAPQETEGYVVRLATPFHYKDFRKSVAKYVRAGHVQHKDGHWSNRRVIVNGLRKS